MPPRRGPHGPAALVSPAGLWRLCGAAGNAPARLCTHHPSPRIPHAARLQLGKKHREHIAAYGEGNERRLTGRHETANMATFLFGVANRGASIRIPRDTEREGKGYFEDRRPAGNVDPYVVTSKIFETTMLL